MDNFIQPVEQQKNPASELWHLRIHLSEYKKELGYDEKFYTFISQRSELVICVYEQHDNRPHLHMLFKETNVTKSTVIQNLLKQFPLLVGNGSYSCSKTDKMKKKKVGDDEKAKAYVCKGENKDVLPVIVGVSQIDIKAYHDKFWEVNEKVKSASSNRTEVNSGFLVSKAKSKTWMDKVKDEIFENYEVECNTIRTYVRDLKPSEELTKQYKLSHKTVFRHYYKSYGKLVKGFDDNVIRKNWNGIYDSILAVDEIAHNNKADNVHKALFPHLI